MSGNRRDGTPQPRSLPLRGGQTRTCRPGATSYDGERRLDLECPLNVDFVEEPAVLVPALGICGDVSEADSWLPPHVANMGAGSGMSFARFPEVLGWGGQEELVCSIWATKAQSTESEDALQMSEEHLDLLSFAT
jgi:hypothetical protein